MFILPQHAPRLPKPYLLRIDRTAVILELDLVPAHGSPPVKPVEVQQPLQNNCAPGRAVRGVVRLLRYAGVLGLQHDCCSDHESGPALPRDLVRGPLLDDGVLRVQRRVQIDLHFFNDVGTAGSYEEGPVVRGFYCFIVDGRDVLVVVADIKRYGLDILSVCIVVDLRFG